MSILNNEYNVAASAGASTEHRGSEMKSKRTTMALMNPFRRQACIVEESDDDDSLVYTSSDTSSDSASCSGIVYEHKGDLSSIEEEEERMDNHPRVRFSEESPRVHYFDQPTEAERELLYYSRDDFQVMTTEYYIERIIEKMMAVQDPVEEIYGECQYL